MTAPKVSASAAALAARLALAALFVPSGWSKLVGFSGVAGYIASKGVPLPELAAALAVGAELGLGLLLVAGFQTRWVGLGLAIFVAAITPIFHKFWAMPPEQVMMQQQMFFKNVGILAGLLMLAGFGPGLWSTDERSGRRHVAALRVNSKT